MPCAHGESAAELIDIAETSELQKIADDSGVELDIKSTILDLASGTPQHSDDIWNDIIVAIKTNAISSGAGAFAAFMGPMLVTALCCRIARGREIRLLCAVISTHSFLCVMENAIQSARMLLERIAAISGAAFPLVSGFLAMSGAVSSQSMLTPMAGFVSTATADIMNKWGIYLSCGACACAICCSFSRTIRLSGIFSILKTSVTWLCGGLMTLFVSILSIHGILSRSYDSAAMRTAEYAVDRMLPVIGGGVSDSLGTILTSISMVRTASGITGMLVLVSACLGPVVQLWSTAFAIKLAAAAASPISDSDLPAAAERFSQVISMLVTVCLTSATMALILLGAAAAAGRGM